MLRLVCGDPNRVLNLQGMLSRKGFQMMQELMPQHPPHLCLQSLFIQMSVHPHEGTVIKDYEPAQMRIPVIFSQDQKIIPLRRRMDPDTFPCHDAPVQFPEEFLRQLAGFRSLP